MANTSADQRAAKAIKVFEENGKVVESVSINGKIMEFKFKSEADNSDEYSFVDFRKKA